MNNSLFSQLIKKLNPIVITKKMTGYELAALAEKECGRAVLYTGSEITVVFNLYSSEKLIEKALGMGIKDAAERASECTNNPLIYANTGQYENITLSSLPIYKHYPGDISGSINTGCVISRDRETYNCGIYRIQPLTDDRAVIHCYKDSGLAKELAKGADVPVTIAIGTAPQLIMAAAAALPADTDELRLAARMGNLRFIETGIYPVPEGTQIVIQGEVSATETHPEGPFMIYTGEYSEVGDFPVLHISSVKMIRGGVYQTLVTGKAPMESFYILRAAERLFKD